MLEGVQTQLSAMEKAKQSYEEQNTKYRVLLQMGEKVRLGELPQHTLLPRFHL